MKYILIAAATVFSGPITFCQSNLEPIEFLIGNWKGIETGAAGNGICFREYTWELGKKFIFSNHYSAFPKSEKNPEGSVHREKSIFSYNTSNSKLSYRELHLDGAVYVYKLEPSQFSSSTLTFFSEEIESISGYWKSKLVITKQSADRFTEELFISTSAQEFRSFIKIEWTREK